MRGYVLIFLLVSILPLVAATDQVVINSQDWHDVYSGLMYAHLNDLDAHYVVEETQGIQLVEEILDKSKTNVLLIESENKPVIFGFESKLERKGFDMEFCSKCGVLLIPKKKGKKAVLYCRKCEKFRAGKVKSKDFKIRVVGDISCDIDGPVASTIRASTIAEPIYGYDPVQEKEVDYISPGVIAVMAVDNLPNELPRDASQGFSESFVRHVIPAFFNGDKDGILDRARMTRNGELTSRFKYLEAYVKGEE